VYCQFSALLTPAFDMPPSKEMAMGRESCFEESATIVTRFLFCNLRKSIRHMLVAKTKFSSSVTHAQNKNISPYVPLVHHEQGCYGLQKEVTTCNSTDGTRGKPADANLSADLQIGQSKIGGKTPPQNH
jgi:hypothetical protein